ncbi:36.4 kDa proline-rich protein-like [Cucurbita pepo subsp. pepo]|nr:36.4 kDa proline-rich protein-like [Cucurbita pepo subsp. pepo]
MESSKIYSLFLLCMLFLSTATPILGCGACGNPPPKKGKPGSGSKSPKGGPIGLPPITLPPIVKPPIDLPPVVKPPISLPPIVKPPVDLPPLPPVTLPPVTVPPVLTKPSPASKPCPPSGKETCPIDTLKLGACVDLLGGLVHIGLGDPAVNECCPVLSGLAEVEAAVCLCTTLKIKALSLNIYVPIALQLLISCGKTPPPGYTCSL